MERAIVLRDPTRIDLLFTMSEIPHADPVKDHTCEVMFSRTNCTWSSSRSVFTLRAPTRQPSPSSGSPSRSWLQPAKAGGARRDRTDDLMLAKHALSQLSYGPVSKRRIPCRARLRKRLRRSSLPLRGPAGPKRRARRLVGLGRLELPTSRLSSARSNQLSYKPNDRPRSSPNGNPRLECARYGLVHEEREMKTAVSCQWT